MFFPIRAPYTQKGVECSLDDTKRYPHGPMSKKDVHDIKARIVQGLGTPLSSNDVVASAPREALEQVMATNPKKPPGIEGNEGADRPLPDAGGP